jgi:trk system potassium uptake protein TrkA
LADHDKGVFSDFFRSLFKEGRRRHDPRAVLVVGLGRFGSSLASTLTEMEYEVCGVDTDPDRVQAHFGRLGMVRVADCTKPEVLEELDIEAFGSAVVCIGNNVESSVLSTVALVEAKVPNIWAKAITDAHGTILRRVGGSEGEVKVVYPEAEMGKRVAHLISGRMMEYISLDDEFVLVELTPPRWLAGVPLSSSNLRTEYNVTVVCVQPLGGKFTYATSESVLGESDVIVVAGLREDVERFAGER